MKPPRSSPVFISHSNWP